MSPRSGAPIRRALIAKLVRGVAAIGLTVGLMGVQPPSALASTTDPGGPGVVLSFANCFDTCTVNVVLSGNGSGTWRSTNSSYVPNGLINCSWLNGAQAPGSDCTESYCCVDRVSLVRVYYVLTPATGSRACYQDSCSTDFVQGYQDLPSTNMPITTTIGGSFTLREYLVTVTMAGTGTGNVRSSPPLFNCPGICTYNVPYGTDLTLNALLYPGSYFAGWSGACTGQSSCNFTVTGTAGATATFNLGSPPTPSAPADTPVPTPTATVKPPVTPKPTKTPTAASTPGASQASATEGPLPSGAASTAPEVSAATAGATADGVITTEPASPGPTGPPVAPVVAGSDLTPIALAILGAGLVIALGIGIATYMLTRRRGTPPS